MNTYQTMLSRVAAKYAMDNKYQADAWNRIDLDSKRKIIAHLKTKWKFPDHIVNRFIRDFERDIEDLVKEESWEKTLRWIDGRAKKVDINPHSSSYGHSLLASVQKQPGRDKLRKPQTNHPKKYGKDSVDSAPCDLVDRVKTRYCIDGPGFSYADLKTALSNGDIKPNQRMVSSVGGGMAKTAKEWLDMGVKVVNANRPYPLDKIKKR